MPSGRSFCEHDMEKLGGKERSRERFRCLRAMQQLGLKEDEKVLFKCLVLFTLGKLLTVTFCFFICVGKCYSAFYSEICILWLMNLIFVSVFVRILRLWLKKKEKKKKRELHDYSFVSCKVQGLIDMWAYCLWLTRNTFIVTKKFTHCCYKPVRGEFWECFKFWEWFGWSLCAKCWNCLSILIQSSSDFVRLLHMWTCSCMYNR